jgi:hypothetical protein
MILQYGNPDQQYFGLGVLLLLEGDGDVTSSHGFLCVGSVTIKPAISARITSQAALSAGVELQPALTANVEMSQCQ